MADQKTILLVEDEAIVALTEQAILRRGGYEVITVHTGETAVEAVDGHPEIDLVLMDINLGPGIDGTEAAQRILSRHDLPLVFLSSHTEPAVVRRTEGITSYGYIVKNTGETVLLASIKMAFRLYHARLRERQAAEELERYFSNSLDLLCIAAMDGRFVRLNPEWERVLGYPVDELLGRRFLDFVHPDDLQPTIAAIARLRSHQEIESFENRYRHRDGSYRWIEWRSRPIGSTIYAAARDVTERRRTEDELRLLDGRHRALLGAFPDLLFLLDREGTFLDYYAKDPTQLYVPPQEFLGRRIPEVLPAEHAAKAMGFLEEVFATGESRSYSYTIDLNGTTLVFEDRLVRCSDDEALSIIRDTTAWHRTTEALRARDNRLTLITEVSPVGIVISDRRERMIYHNERFVDLFGYTAEDVSDVERWFELAYPDPDARERVRADWSSAVEEARAQGGEIVPVETSVTCRDGTTREVEFRFKTTGEYNVVVFTDITARKRAERRAEDLLREKEVLLSESRHRVRNNMGVVRSLLSLEADSHKDIVCVGAFRRIAGNVQSMLTLDEQLHELEQYAELSLRAYLPPLVRQVVELHGGTRTVDITIEIEDIVLPTRVLSPLGIIVNELITNTMKHAFPGPQGGTIRISAERADALVSLIYSDDGVGMPATVDRNRSLGLVIIESLVEQIDGELVVERENGTRFTITFPDPGSRLDAAAADT